LALVLGVGRAAWAVEQTVVLRRGVTGDEVVVDTNVQSNDWDDPPQYTINYGRNELLVLDRDGGSSVLIRFDLSGIPANARVTSARLELQNTTASPSGGQGPERRVEIFRVLRAWDEGNQVAGRVSTTPGAHGATGDYAVEHYPGEGENVAWKGRGLEAGTDYDPAVLDVAEIRGTGPYSWDLTSAVQDWVRGVAPNHGIVLRDATGWEDGNPDWRSFVSSESPEVEVRPALTVVYDPDTPLADAGEDVEELHWDGSAVSLNGSGSHDHPGGDDGSLGFSWRIVRGAWGSSLSGEVCDTAICRFAPDRAGEWELELVVENA